MAATREAWEQLRKNVGRTPLRAAPVLGRQLGIPNLHLKDEGANPTGSMTDRLALAHIEAAKASHHETIAVAADGPAIRSFAILAREAGLRLVVHTAAKAGPQWTRVGEENGARIVRAGENLADAMDASVEAALANKWYDANPKEGTRPLRLGAYAPLGLELAEVVGAGVVAVPTREGSAVAGIWSAFESRRVRPKLLAATTKMGNPIVFSLAEGHEECQDLDSKEVWRSETSAVLATHKAMDGTPCMKALRASGGWAYGASDPELVSLANHLLRAEKIEALPAATAGIAALHFAAKFGKLREDETHVAVITARPQSTGN